MHGENVLMKLKTILVGGLVYFVVMFIASMASAMITHDGMLVEVYKTTAMFWRPELRSEPPDMGALMPLWITTGLISSFITAGVYSLFHSALSGPGWRRGLVFGFAIGLLYFGLYGGLYGVFDVPAFIWEVWAVEGLVLTMIASAALGAVVQKID